ncbi:histidine kinase [Actinomyces gerencseriae]
MPALDVPPRHSTLGRVITGLMAFTVLWGLFVGVHPQPSPRVQMVMLLAMALLTVAALWLRRRDRCAYERRLAREAAARAVVEDRLVIARELHDAVSGNLGAITVRCAVAQRLETSPDGLRHALRDVESASREATDGLRRMLAVLRDEGAAAHGIPDPTGASGMAGPVRAAGSAGPAIAAGAPGGPGDRMIRPARGAPAGAGAPHGAGTAGAAVAASWRESGIGAGDPDSALAGAVTRARRAGVEVEIDADRGAGPSPMGEAVARVVGEALVNTARHAGPSRARVTVRREFSRLDASPRHRPGTSGTARAGRGHGRDAERGTPPRCRRCWSWWRRRCWRPGRRRCGWDGRGRRGREGGLRRRGGPAAARDADRRSRRGDRFESRPARVRGGIP